MTAITEPEQPTSGIAPARFSDIEMLGICCPDEDPSDMPAQAMIVRINGERVHCHGPSGIKVQDLTENGPVLVTLTLIAGSLTFRNAKVSELS